MQISSIIALLISLVLLGWWAANNVATLSAIISGHHNTINQIGNKSRKAPIAPSFYKPVHYVFFSGNGSYGLIPASQNLNVRQFSITFWTKSDGPGHDSFDRPIETLQWMKNSSETKIPYGWAFDADDQSKVGVNKLRFTVGSNSGNLFTTNDVNVPNNNWTYIAGTFDGKILKLYQSGALVDSFHFRGSYAYHTPLPIRLAIGWLPHHYWTGDLSDIRIYKRALSQFEINSIFHGHTNASGLVGWWKLNEGRGNLIADSSGFRSDGTIHNVIWK